MADWCGRWRVCRSTRMSHSTRSGISAAQPGTGLDIWLTRNGINRLIISGIRTEQCCETTTRHASDLGWSVDFVSEAPYTFPMQHADGTVFGRPTSSSGRNSFWPPDSRGSSPSMRASGLEVKKAHDGQPDRQRHAPHTHVRGYLPADTLLLDVAGPMEVFRRANLEQSAVQFDYAYVGAAAEQATSIGLTVSGLLPLTRAAAGRRLDRHLRQPDRACRPREEPRGTSEIARWLRSSFRPDMTLVTNLLRRASCRGGRPFPTASAVPRMRPAWRN